jgi:hypothetical protein
VSVMTGKQMSAAEVQRRATKIAMQASKLADQAGPATQRVAMSARQSAGEAAEWAKPRIGTARSWMAVRAANSSVAVQETLAPRVSTMLASAARTLDPPKPRARRWPKVLAGITLLAAGAAAAAAMAMRNRQQAMPPPIPPRQPARGTTGSSTVLNPSAEDERAMTETDVNGLSRTR